MKKVILTSLMVAALMCAMALSAAAADAPADMMLKAPAGMKVTKTEVAFSHAGHAAIKCLDCHHKAADEASIAGCAVAGCHDQPGKKGDNSFYVAYHKGKRSCVGCHKAEKKGPKSCKECHPK